MAADPLKEPLIDLESGGQERMPPESVNVEGMMKCVKFVQSRANAWNTAADDIIAELQKEGVQRGQVLQIDAHNNGPDEEAILAAYYCLDLPGRGTLNIDYIKTDASEDLSSLCEQASSTCGSKEVISVTGSCNGSSNFLYVFFYRDQQSDGADVNHVRVIRHDHDWLQAADELVSELVNLEVQDGQILSINVMCTPDGEKIWFSAQYSKKLKARGKLALKVKMMGNEHSWDAYYLWGANEMQKLKTAQFVAVTASIAPSWNTSVAFVFFQDINAKATAVVQSQIASDDILPNILSLGEHIKEVVKKHPERLMFQMEACASGANAKHAWTHYYSTYIPSILRLIKLQFLNEQKHRSGGTAGAIKNTLRMTSLVVGGGAVRIIKAVQVAEKVKTMASKSTTVSELLTAFLPTAQSDVLDGIPELDNTTDQFEVEIMRKFINVFCLMAMYANPPICTSYLHQYSGTDAGFYPRQSRVLLSDPREVFSLPRRSSWWADHSSSNDVRALTFKDYIEDDVAARLKPVNAAPFMRSEWDRDPLHVNWLALDSGLLFGVTRYWDYFGRTQDNGNGTEAKILVEFVDLLSSCIGELKAQLELVQAGHSKLISVASTGFLSALTILQHKMSAGAV